MSAGLDERAHVFADQAAFADIDQLLGRLALLRVQLVLTGDRVEILDDAIAEIRAVTDLEQQAVEAVGLGRRMLVKLVAAVLELEAAVFSRRLPGLHGPAAGRQKTHHAEAMVPGRDVV